MIRKLFNFVSSFILPIKTYWKESVNFEKRFMQHKQTLRIADENSFLNSHGIEKGHVIDINNVRFQCNAM